MSSPEQVQLSGRLVRITYQNPENGYTVAKLQVEGSSEPITVVGRLTGAVEGQDLKLSGRRMVHAKFGPQVEVESFSLRAPSDEEGVRRFLASGLVKGVGPKLAEQIVDHLGIEALEVIKDKPEKLRTVPGIGAKRARSIASSLAGQEELREFMVFLQSHGVPVSTALRIHRHYGAQALSVVQTQPHRLAADMQGVGFATADRIASQIGIAHDHPLRLEAGLVHTLHEALDQGHIYLPYEQLLESAAQLLKLERGSLGVALASLLQQGRITLQGEGEGRRVYLSMMLALEEQAAEGLARLLKTPGLLPPQRATKAVQWAAGEMVMTPSPGQAQALSLVLTQGLSVLTGGPGTGKTTILRALIAIALRMDQSVALAAPTGRAAKRLSEATGHPAFTLHRLLEYLPKENRFARGADKPLEADLVVVDESSMMDVWLCAHLLEAVRPPSRLVLVGDANQLPSVGPGLVLRQIMASGQAPVAELTQIFRQKAGYIVANAHRVLHGEMPQTPPPGQEGDFFFLPEPDPGKAAELVRDLACRRLPARYGLDPVEDIQVLAPMHRGRLGCRALNQLLRSSLNPGPGDPQNEALRAGDKVMQVRNNYDLEVFNGDLGRMESRNDQGAVVDMGDRRVAYAPSDLDDLTLAYCVTIHKSQGSEYPAVIIALASEHFIMLNRPLIYTALTRGRDLVVVVGHPGALARAVERDQPVHRFASLDERIRERAQGGAEQV